MKLPGCNNAASHPAQPPLPIRSGVKEHEGLSGKLLLIRQAQKRRRAPLRSLRSRRCAQRFLGGVGFLASYPRESLERFARRRIAAEQLPEQLVIERVRAQLRLRRRVALGIHESVFVD